jgi:hypothetical protein
MCKNRSSSGNWDPLAYRCPGEKTPMNRAGTCRYTVFLLPCVLLGSVLGAQSVQGVVTDPNGAKVPGVVVTLVDSASLVVARSLTNDHGEYRMVGRAGDFQLRTLRIGFAPTTTPLMGLATGEMRSVDLKVSAVALRLDTMRTAAKSTCHLSARDSLQTTWRVWDQVRAALTAGELTARSRALMVTTATYARDRRLLRDSLLGETVSVATERVRIPWQTLSGDSLRKGGYVEQGADSIGFYAPGLDVIASDQFVEDHCFRLAVSDANLIAIDFEPNAERRKLPEIRGSAWVDRQSAELRRIDFRFVNIPSDLAEVARGQLEFGRLANGNWIIRRWSLHLPVLVQVSLPGEPFRAEVREEHVVGGDLVTVTTQLAELNDTLWKHPPVTLAGVVVDSTTGDPVADAQVTLERTGKSGVSDRRGRFEIAGVLPGKFDVAVRTASLDSLNAATRYSIVLVDSMLPVSLRVPSVGQVLTSLCGERTRKDQGLLVGNAAFRAGNAAAEVPVRAAWIGANGEAHLMQTRTSGAGSYLFCSIPTDRTVSVQAIAQSASSAPSSVRLSSSRRHARVDLMLDSGRVATASMTGYVLTDSTERPIADAEVSILDVGLIASSSSTGAFQIAGIPPGDHHLRVRKIGYGVLDTTLHFAAAQSGRRRIYLSPVTLLDSVKVVGRVRDTGMDEFWENRRLGLGHFYTREQIAKFDNLKVADFLVQTPGAAIALGSGHQAWISGNGRVTSLHSGFVVNPVDAALGAKSYNCYSTVYLDDAIVFDPGTPRSPDGRVNGTPVSSSAPPLFDINSISPSQIEAIEYYSGPGQIPQKYMRLNTPCGVMVIHTRR